MWTLAVEEQFYIVLPLVFFATRRSLVRHPVRASVIALIGAIASTVWMAVLFSPTGDPTRAYIGTDSHAMGLLVGVAMGVLAGAGRPWEAFTERVCTHSNVTRLAPVLAAVALLVILVMMRIAAEDTAWLFRGGFLFFSVLCAVIVAVLASMPAAPISRALRTPALVAIGVRSYSLYLWHWPVRVFITPSSGLHGATLFIVRLAISVVLAEISYRFIEQPFRTGIVARRAGSRPAIAYFAVLSVGAAVLVATVAAPTALPPTHLSQVSASSQTDKPGALRVDVFGDSTGLTFALGGAFNSNRLNVVVGGAAELGCGIVQTGRVSGRHVFRAPPDCKQWATRWKQTMREDPTARLALMAGAWETFDQKQRSGVVIRFGTAAWTDLIRSSVRDALTVLTSDGRTVHLFEVPCYGAGDANANPERHDPARIAAVNEIFNEAARTMPNVEIVHWRTLVCPNGTRAESVDRVHLWQPDDQHLTWEGAAVVWKWWLPQLRAEP
jgi:hypothetical protein